MLGVNLLLSGASLGLTLFCSRLRRRPLNLHRDPGSVAAVVSMILEDPKLRERFRGSDKLPEDSMKLLLAGTTCRMIHGRLLLEIDESARSSLDICHQCGFVSLLLLIIFQDQLSTFHQVHVEPGFHVH